MSTLRLARPLRADRFNRYDFETGLCWEVARSQRFKRFLERAGKGRMVRVFPRAGRGVWVSTIGIGG